MGVFGTFVRVNWTLRVAERLLVAMALTGARHCALITVLGIVNGCPLIVTIRIISRIVIVNEISKLTIIVKN